MLSEKELKSKVIELIEENKCIFEYGQNEIFDFILDNVDDYYFNGVSTNKIGYSWYTVTIDNTDYQLYTK